MISTYRSSRPYLLLLLACAPVAGAQSLNVDIGQNVVFPVPASSYAAQGAAGTWNSVAAPGAAAALVGLNGAPVAATLSSSGGFLNFDFDNAGTSGDAQSLLDDVHDLGGPTSAVSWSFAGLAAGDYSVYTYAWAPDNTTFRTTVSIAGALDPDQNVGGAWTGSHQLGVTYALHRVTVSGGNLTIVLTTSSGFGSLNGFQLVREAAYPTLCAGDGSATACPCGNSGAAGRGCANSIDPSGGLLAASGAASVAGDTLVLSGSGMPNASALYFQGSSAVAGGAGAAFGDGLRCAGGAVTRLGTKTNAAGSSQYPVAGDIPVSVRGVVAPGDARVYQVWYRNAASFCTPDTFNLTNGVRVTWGV
ncbi:MAG: hypothetical protein NTY35_10600 [Planctomycetota bacterium]|nr:hypothetical protein [Planctomycetota bacterium]